MTSDELFFAVETAWSELDKARETLRVAQNQAEGARKMVLKAEQVQRAQTEALRHLLFAPVVSLKEHESLKEGLASVNAQLKEFNERLIKHNQEELHALKDIAFLEKRVIELQLEQERCDAGGVILEFSNDKCRSQESD